MIRKKTFRIFYIIQECQNDDSCRFTHLISAYSWKKKQGTFYYFRRVLAFPLILYFSFSAVLSSEHTIENALWYSWQLRHFSIYLLIRTSALKRMQCFIGLLVGRCSQRRLQIKLLLSFRNLLVYSYDELHPSYDEPQISSFMNQTTQGKLLFTNKKSLKLSNSLLLYSCQKIFFSTPTNWLRLSLSCFHRTRENYISCFLWITRSLWRRQEKVHDSCPSYSSILHMSTNFHYDRTNIK